MFELRIPLKQKVGLQFPSTLKDNLLKKLSLITGLFLILLTACGDQNSNHPAQNSEQNELQDSSKSLKPNNRYFKRSGSLSSFKWAPTTYKSTFLYDVTYYIPEKIKDSSNVKSLIFMHGGGSSTMTREGSLEVSLRYKNYVKQIADELGMIVVLPSASGLNWGGHTYYMLKELAALMRRELKLDANNIGLTGHSMGGMGITRSAVFLGDEFAYFVPVASGTDERQIVEEHVNKSFNTPYVQLQGLKDHFEVFVTRNKAQEKLVHELEAKYGEKSKYEMIFYDGDHQMNTRLWIDTIKRLQQSPRDLFQKKLYGVLRTNANFYVENNIRFFQGSASRYFWVSVSEADYSKVESVNFRASIENNRIEINFAKRPEQFKKIKVSLSKKMINFAEEVTISVDGRETIYKPRSKGIVSISDQEFEFDDFVEIDL